MAKKGEANGTTPQETPDTTAPAADTPAPMKPARKKKASTVPENETVEARFIRLGKLRALKAQSAILAVGKLTGRNYASTPEQRAKILTLLTGALATVKQRMDGEQSAGPSFDL